MTFADHLIAIRTARQWSPVELARRARLTPSAIYLMEKGQRKHPDIVTLCKLARATGLSLDYLAAPFCIKDEAA